LPPANAKYGIAVDSLAQTVGLKDGDIILKVDTTTLKDIGSVKGRIVLEEATSLTVKRGDSLIELKLDDGLVRKLNTRTSGSFVNVRAPFVVNKFAKKSNAEKAGILAEDRVIGVNGIETLYYHEYKRATKDIKDTSLVIKVLRGNDTITKTVQFDKNGLIGC
jgi:regulator of sigma E protease